MKFTLASAVAVAFLVSEAIAGQASFYRPNGHKGACGKPINNNDLALALPKSAYSRSKCGHKVEVTYKGKTITGYVQDLCPGCASDKVDLTEGWFKRYAPTSQGILKGVTWKVL